MKNALAGFLAVLLTGTSAVGADLYQAEPAPAYVEAPEVQITQSSGWYLRGDVGYSFNKLRGAHYYQGGPTGSLRDFDTADIKDSYVVGAGVGYQVNSYLRSDLTFDYLTKSDFDGSTKGRGAAFGACVGPCTSSDKSSMSAYSLMANAYVDLGNYGMFTPYVGAGIGGAYVKWDKLRNTACQDDGGGCDDTITHKGYHNWRFAYQLMAGGVIAASLITGLNSDLPGLVIAQVTENVFDSATGRFLLIPQGARLIGSYDSVVAFGQRRALLVWQRIILPDGASIQLDNLPATDAAGYAGLADQVDFHTWQLLKGVALSTLLGVGTELNLGDGESDLVRAIRQSTQQSASQAGQQIVGKQLDVQPTLRIRPGWPLRVIVHKDLILRPWRAL